MVHFSLVDPMQGREAYQWHRGFAASNDSIFPRSQIQFQQFAEDGQIWCARDEQSNYVALAYFCLEKGTWEVGGLMVAKRERGNGVGSTIMRLTLGHLLFVEDPLARAEPVIAHVLAENADPRPIIEHALKFRLFKTIKVPGSTLPGLKTNAEGQVEGDEFVLVNPDTLSALATWCDAWDGRLKDGGSAQVLLSPGTSLSMWASAFRDMISRPTVSV